MAYLIRTSIVIRSSTNHKQFAYTASHCRRAHCFLKGSNFSPSIWKGIITFYAAKSVLPIIASNNIYLYVKYTWKNLNYEKSEFWSRWFKGSLLFKMLNKYNCNIFSSEFLSFLKNHHPPTTITIHGAFLGILFLIVFLP